MKTEFKAVPWCGLDVAKNSFESSLYLPLHPGEQPRSINDLPKKTFPRTVNGVKLFHDWSFQLRDKFGLPGGDLRIVMEATGRYSKELAQWLIEEMPFSQPAIEDPCTIKSYIKSLKIHNKTDKIDAGAIARYGYERMPKPTVNLPKDYSLLRELTRLRSATKQQLVAANGRLAELTNDFPEIIKIQQCVVESLKDAVNKLELKIKSCISESDELRKSTKIAQTIPGVGLITAATVLGECGPLRYFKSRELGSYSGLAPVLKHSGTSIHSSRISRHGPAGLRQCLYMAANAAMEYNPKMRALHSRIIARGKKPMQAHCAVMRKLLILIRAVVVSGEQFQSNYTPSHV